MISVNKKQRNGEKTMNMEIRKIGGWCAVFLMGVVLSGCGTKHQMPPEIGTGTNDLKASNCEACKLKPFYRNGQWLIER